MKNFYFAFHINVDPYMSVCTSKGILRPNAYVGNESLNQQNMQ